MVDDYDNLLDKEDYLKDLDENIDYDEELEKKKMCNQRLVCNQSLLPYHKFDFNVKGQERHLKEKFRKW